VTRQVNENARSPAVACAICRQDCKGLDRAELADRRGAQVAANA
jgi:hypothetical protein